MDHEGREEVKKSVFRLEFITEVSGKALAAGPAVFRLEFITEVSGKALAAGLAGATALPPSTNALPLTRRTSVSRTSWWGYHVPVENATWEQSRESSLIPAPAESSRTMS